MCTTLYTNHSIANANAKALKHNDNNKMHSENADISTSLIINLIKIKHVDMPANFSVEIIKMLNLNL